MPKVTVAIPTYNREAYLKDCLTSLQLQVFQDFEVIIFDNGSTYDSRSLIEQFPTLKIALQKVEDNIGQDANFLRMYTFQYASPYVIFFHDDDALHPELLAAEVKILDSHDELMWVGSSFKFVKSSDLMLSFEKVDLNNKIEIYDVAGLVRQVLKGFPLCFDSVMYRNGTFGPHMDLVQRFSKWSDRPQVITWAGKGKVGLINLPLVNFRLHYSQDSAQKVESESYLGYAKNLFKFYKDNLPQPLSSVDKNLWFSHTSNQLILFATQNTKTIREFFVLLNSFSPEFFSWKYLRPKGIYYMFKKFIKV